MRFANEAADTAFRVLSKCTDELRLERPWRWRSVVQNGTRLPIAATLNEDFLHLDCQPDVSRTTAYTIERAILHNRTVGGGVKLALNDSSQALHMATDILVRDEKQLLDRFRWALDGFHDGCDLLAQPLFDPRPTQEHRNVGGINLADLMNESSWRLTERGPGEFTTELDSRSSPSARLRATTREVTLTAEFLRTNTVADCSKRAIALFLLTASSSLRLARAYGTETEGTWTCGMMVSLPAVPAIEEIDHGLAALSVAHRICAREANVLLDEAAARCYLTVRDVYNDNHHFHEQEI